MNGSLGKIAVILVPVLFAMLLALASAGYSSLTGEVERISNAQRNALAERQILVAGLDARVQLLEQGTTRELMLVNRRLDGIEVKLDRVIGAR